MEEAAKYDWGKIECIFNPALTPDKIAIDYELDFERLALVRQTIEKIQERIAHVQYSLGLKGVNPVNLDEAKRNEFRDKIKSDLEWQTHFTTLAFLYDIPGADARKFSTSVNRPWWNTLNFGLINDESSSDSYRARAGAYPSLLTQLTEAGITGLPFQGKFKPCSISNVLITGDNKLVLGYRSGANYFDTIMTVPAGSVEPHLSPGERGALFGSQDKELYEEVRFKKGEQFQETELIGKSVEKYLVAQSWLYYNFRTTTPLSLKETISHWKNAVDRKEHHRLVAFENDPDFFMKWARLNAFDRSEALPGKYNETISGNKGTILPQAALTVYTHFAQQYGSDWAERAERYLGGHFDLTSCFKQ